MKQKKSCECVFFLPSCRPAQAVRYEACWKKKTMSFCVNISSADMNLNDVAVVEELSLTVLALMSQGFFQCSWG